MALHLVSPFPPNAEAEHLLALTMQACDTATAAAAHAIDGLVHGSDAALAKVRACEQQLDDLDRELDQRMAPAITEVTPCEARELLACLKLMLNLERIGDLIANFAERAAAQRNRLDMDDIGQLTRMACILENMLAQTARAFTRRDVDQALQILRSDAEMDRLRNLLVMRHTEGADGLRGQASLHVLWMANALERAGDHAKNIAEETCHLATGRTVRHTIPRHQSSQQLDLDWAVDPTHS